ncbi:MAG: hypothetical protein WC027_01195 [Candidatus Paceibacterota bacterium]
MAGSKPKPSAPPPNTLLGLTFWAFVLVFALIFMVIMRFFPKILQQDLSETAKNIYLLLPDYAVLVMMRLFSFSLVLSIILIIIVIWTSNQIIRHKKKMLDALVLPGTEAPKGGVPKMFVNEKWESVVKHINSSNPSDWKLAILECDIMLGEILEKMGYIQPSIGEKLKSIEPSDFTNIEAAWEAHKIRNSIAHEGSEFAINEREAKRVIGLYELVFQEFEYI